MYPRNLVNPNRIPPGMQRVSVRVPMRRATCEEVNCSWFLHGIESEDADGPFTHPAGVRCGDSARCPHPNCPCPQRALSHKVPDERYQPIYTVATNAGTEAVVPGEWMERLAAGAEAAHTIKTRGL